MEEYAYENKSFKQEIGSSDSQFNLTINKPLYCPICNLAQDGAIADRKLWNAGDGRFYGTIMYTCNRCRKKYLATYDVDVRSHSGSFGAFYPTVSTTYTNDIIEPVSPRFIAMYNQAYRAEQAGDIELAAVGYRQALECMVKDYAIAELGKSHEEVASKSLYNAIVEYLETDLVSTADVIRILGNDYAHYERRHMEVDFPILKRYMGIFIQLLETKLLIAHPPVAR